MTKSELFKMLEKVGDNEQIFVVSNDYELDDDSTWMGDTQTEISEVLVDECGEGYIKLECSEFM